MASVMELARKRVRELVAVTIEEGRSLGELQRSLRKDYAFSRERAVAIARTETATAHGVGALTAAQNAGKDEQKWVSQGEGIACEICWPNEDEGWVPVGHTYASGENVMPAHINCRCTIRYRTKELHEEDNETRAGDKIETKCPKCSRLLGKNLGTGAEIKSARCSELVTVTGGVLV